jgi:hypothetical protein
MKTIDENQVEESGNKKSELINLENAKSNYEYYLSICNLIPMKYKIKIHPYYYKLMEIPKEKRKNPDIEKENVDFPIEPVTLVMFSWKGINNECYSFPLSFHIDCEEFREKLKRFVSIEMPQIQTEMPQESNNWWQM